MTPESDISSRTVTDGGVAGKHPTLTIHPIFVGPSTNGEFNAIEETFAPEACVRLDDVRFEFDSSFIGPEASTELVLLSKLVKEKPGRPASIFGHADPVGDDNYNKQLSGRRAQAMYALLTRKTEIWEALYKNPIPGGDNWGTKSIQLMLQTLGLYDGALNGTLDNATRNAVKDFQRSPAGSGLKDDGDPGPKTREKLFKAYMDTICVDSKGKSFQLDPVNDFLARGADPDGKGDYQGCSEFNPDLVFSQSENSAFQAAPNKTQRNKENQPNRRVVVYLFRKGSKISPDKWPCPRAKEGITDCKKRFFSDGEVRRSNQALRRKYEETKDTFACRFYDRIGVLSPCEGPPPVVKFDVRLTLELGDVDQMFPAIAAQTHTDNGVRQRLQAVGFLYAPLNDANIAQKAQDAWNHFKKVTAQTTDAGAVTELQKMVREVIMDQASLPDVSEFKMIRVPGAYLFTDLAFFSNAATLNRFIHESDVWTSNPSLGLIPLIAKVEEIKNGAIRPAPAGIKVHFQLIPPDQPAAGTPTATPALRSTSIGGTRVFNLDNTPGAGQNLVASTITLNGSPQNYVTLERARNPPVANDPQVDNVHQSVGGKRGGAVAGANRLANILETATTRVGFHDVNNFTPAQPSSHPNAVVATTNDGGQAAAILMPARTGGDRYKLRVFLDTVQGTPSDGTEANAIKEETGTMVVWRILHFSNYLRWDYPAGATANQQAACGGALDNFDVTGRMFTEYRKANLDPVSEEAATGPWPKTMTQAEWQAALIDAKSRVAPAMGTLGLSQVYELDALLPHAGAAGALNNPSPGLLNFRTAAAYDAARTNPATPSANALFTNPTTNAQYWADMSRIFFRALDEVMQHFTKNAISGLTVLQAPVLASFTADNIPTMPVTPWRNSGFAVTRRGCYVMFGNNIYRQDVPNPSMPYDATSNALHETGHELFGLHQYTGPSGDEFIQTNQHDYHDFCVMGYQRCPADFCGRCVLNQAGWNTQAFPVNGP